MENTRLATEVECLVESLGPLPEPVAYPALVVVSGLPGTGKTYFCGKLAERMPLAVLESDALRKVLFSPASYSPEESSHLFAVVHRLIGRLLKKGISIILDATNLAERNREYLYSIAEHLGTKLVLVRVEAPPQVVYQRLKHRLNDSGNKSDADWAVYQRMRTLAQRIHRQHYAVDTSRDITSVLDKIVRAVGR